MNQTLSPTRPAVGTRELLAALETALSQYYGNRRRVAELKRRPSEYRTSFAIEELELVLDDGAELSLIFKDLNWHDLPENVRQAKPYFLYDPVREIEVYRSILSTSRMGTPACYGSLIEREAGLYWLFLEKVPGVELYQVGDFELWLEVARWLSTSHALFAGKAEPLRRNMPLLVHDADFYRRWLRRAIAFAGRQSNGNMKAGRGLAWLAERYDSVIEQLVALPLTFIHGEFYASNILIQSSGIKPRVCPIDWETAAVGPGLMDLAALVAGNWSGEEKVALATTYHMSLKENDAAWASAEEMLRALDYCSLALSVQWLGWSEQWSPPPEHRQDWLDEALRLAAKLNL
jgi:hypothetical protein